MTAKDVQDFLKKTMGVAQPDDEMIRLAGAMYGKVNAEKGP